MIDKSGSSPAYHLSRADLITMAVKRFACLLAFYCSGPCLPVFIANRKNGRNRAACPKRKLQESVAAIRGGS
jgi:hypothetical protein